MDHQYLQKRSVYGTAFITQVHRTTANLSHHIDEIEALCKGEKLAVTTDYIEVTYPLRADFEVSFKIPKDISKDEAQRLSSYFASLYFTK